jgi:uncharacterized protein
MPDHSTPAVGTFCWVELQTTDVAAARAFYSSIFGWTIVDTPDPAPYGIASIDGRMTAGLMELPPEALATGVSPRWLSYVAVDDVEAFSRRAVDLGATLLVPPATMGPGTISVLRDPTDSILALWHGEQPLDAGLYGELGAFGWNELITTDLDQARRFYTELFGWTAESVPMPNVGYVLLKRDGADIGGIMTPPSGSGFLNVGWCVYFVVADADAVFRRSVALGARILMPLSEVPTVGRFGFLQDPQGAMFAVIRLEPRAA